MSSYPTMAIKTFWQLGKTSNLCKYITMVMSLRISLLLCRSHMRKIALFKCVVGSIPTACTNAGHGMRKVTGFVVFLKKQGFKVLPSKSSTLVWYTPAQTLSLAEVRNLVYQFTKVRLIKERRELTRSDLERRQLSGKPSKLRFLRRLYILKWGFIWLHCTNSCGDDRVA